MHGSLDAEEALQRLLQGSGLRARRIDERTLTLEPIPASGALDLDATTVSAAAPAQGYRPAANASISRGDAPPGNPPGDQRGPGTGAAGPAPAQP
ncbi:STN domain-containing protein [Pseudomonas aeruginosa]|nr:STN domain-containing protein [Pseudomonas aeruginosa]